MEDNIIKVSNIKEYFTQESINIFKKKKYVKACDDISFEIKRGETLGIVGESGCGKSTCGRTILQLLKPTSGKVFFNGKDLTNMKRKELRELRTKMQLVFQDPYSSLNPRMTVGDIIGEALIDHKLITKKDLKKYVIEIMKMCGLPEYYINRFPHEFSGGQRQRIGIARALALNPEFIVLDEPVSALDVSIQAQIINLLVKLKKEQKLTYMFISHDLSIVKHISDRIAVMYLGQIVELAPKDELFDNPFHQYTKALLSAIPVPDPKLKRNRIILKGDLPSPVDQPKGCKFNTRCPYAEDICKKQAPIYKEIKKEHFVACHKVKGENNE